MNARECPLPPEMANDLVYAATFLEGGYDVRLKGLRDALLFLHRCHPAAVHPNLAAAAALLADATGEALR